MKRPWTRDELAEHWNLAPNELELLANKSGATRLGFVALLKAFMLEGRFPRQKHELPGVVIVHLAKQVNVPAELYPRYEWSGRTIEYHRSQIRTFLGFREATVQDGHELVAWLAEQVTSPESTEMTMFARLSSNAAARCTSSHRRPVALIALSGRPSTRSKSAGARRCSTGWCLRRNR